ncbi:MAG: chemotaxis protein CheD [Thermodesulfovibrionales bacterium]|nr:chemotaxis protein CheD [Thermodesulfovibrionales bacterium]
MSCNQDTSSVTKQEHYLYPGELFARNGAYIVTTILGSCVSVCLYDPVLRIGGINHYMLALWNGEGLPSPRYGNIAIEKLVERLVNLGASIDRMKAKVFGGAAVLQSSGGLMGVGERNIIVAEDMLADLKIPIVSKDVGGVLGRKIIFHTDTAEIFLKRIKPSNK